MIVYYTALSFINKQSTFFTPDLLCMSVKWKDQVFKINKCSKLMSQLKKKLDTCFFIHMRNRVLHPNNVDIYIYITHIYVTT